MINPVSTHLCVIFKRSRSEVLLPEQGYFMLDINLAHAGATLLWFYCFEIVSLYLAWVCVEIWFRLSMEIDKLYIIDVGNFFKKILLKI